MNCPREDELLDALQRGCVGPELETHVHACGACAELRAVAGALIDDRAAAIAGAPIPSSATMLHRVRLRHRQEAAAAARRTLLLGQAATLLIAIVAAAALFGRNVASSMQNAWTLVPISSLVLLVLWMVAAPIAGWVVARSK